MDKDFITIETSDGGIEKMEVVATFKLKETSKDYIIYRSLDGKHYYAASYDDSVYTSKLNTNLSEKEKMALNIVFEALKNGGVNNA